MFLLIIIIVY